MFIHPIETLKYMKHNLSLKTWQCSKRETFSVRDSEEIRGSQVEPMKPKCS